MTLSVIIPVYRVEETLNRCIESVSAQNVDDMEIILVDDGSSDKCPLMCDEWAEKDSRIRVIHKNNGGLSDARNAGLNIATGEYITFVDSDDYLSPNTYPPLMPLMKGCDILEYSVTNKLLLQDNTYHIAADYWLKERAYTHAFACNKIYRRNVFNGVLFPKGRVYEDMYTLPILLRNASIIKTTHNGYYNYCFNPNGITAKNDGRELSQLLDAHLNCQMPIDDNYYMHIVNVQMDVWERTKAPIIMPKRHVNITLLHGRAKIKACLLNILGINILCRISKALHLFKQPSSPYNI